MHLSPPPPSRCSGLGSCPFKDGSFVVVDPLLIVAPIVCWGGGLCWVLVLLFSTLCPSSVAITYREKRVGYFTLIVFLMSCGC